MKNRFPYMPGTDPKWPVPDSLREVFNPYDQDPRMFYSLKQPNLKTVSVQTINLTAAGSLSVPESGWHFVLYGWQNESAGPPVVPGNRPVNTTIFVQVQINTDQQNSALDWFPAKHGRGYSGPFTGLFLRWDAQTSSGAPLYADLVIYKNFDKPWIDGETPT